MPQGRLSAAPHIATPAVARPMHARPVPAAGVTARTGGDEKSELRKSCDEFGGERPVENILTFC